MELVPCAIKAQDEFPGLVSSPRCCACASLHRRYEGRSGCSAWCSAWRRSGEEAGVEGFICVWFKILARSLIATPGMRDVRGVGDVRITIWSLFSCGHYSVYAVWPPLPNGKKRLYSILPLAYKDGSAQPSQAMRGGNTACLLHASEASIDSQIIMFPLVQIPARPD